MEERRKCLNSALQLSLNRNCWSFRPTRDNIQCCHVMEQQSECTGTLCPAVTLFPPALFFFFYHSLTGKDQHHLFLLHPFFFLSSPRHLHLHFYAHVLFIHSSQIKSREMRDICCTYFEDASCCSITCKAKVSFAFSGVGSASLTGGGSEHAWQAVW